MFGKKIGFLAAATLLTVLLTSASAFADNTVIMIHGFNKDDGTNCTTYFGNQLSTIVADKGPTNVRTLGWYKYDTGCTDYLPWAQRHDNTRDTPISEIAGEIAHYIHNNFTSFHEDVDIVAHSLGGLIARDMISRHGTLDPTRPSRGQMYLRIDNVVTLGTPHSGVVFSLPAFTGCLIGIGQCIEAQDTSSFINSLEHNPQAQNGTQWTIIGSERDGVVGPTTGIEMRDGASWKPDVDWYNYPAHHRDSTHCAGDAPIGHGDLIRANPTGYCRWSFWGLPRYYSVQNPTDRVLAALD